MNIFIDRENMCREYYNIWLWFDQLVSILAPIAMILNESVMISREVQIAKEIIHHLDTTNQYVGAQEIDMK